MADSMLWCIRHWKWPPFFLNDGCNDVFGNHLSAIDALHRVDIEGSAPLSFWDRSTLYYFGNGRHFLKWLPRWQIQRCGVFGNTFSEIYAPQNLYLESKLKALRLLVSGIDVLLWKWPPFFKMASKMTDTISWCIRQYFFWNLRPTKYI